MKTITEILEYPVKTDYTYIWDKDNAMIAQVRGWGRLQYMDDAEALQDMVSDFIVDAINEKLERDYGFKERPL